MSCHVVAWKSVARGAGVLLALTIVAGTSAATRFVDADATAGLKNGSAWADAYLTLQDALAVATGSDVILVAQGTYRPDQGGGESAGDRTATFTLVNGVDLVGGFAGVGEPDPDRRDIDLYETILSGDLDGDDGPNFANNGENSHHVVTGTGTDATTLLDGFTIRGGNTDGSTGIAGGGLVLDAGSNMTVRNCTFTANHATRGGAIVTIFSTDAAILGCRFVGNAAVRGGALYNEKSSFLSVINCEFTNNAAGSEGGGGMMNLTSSPDVINTLFVGNTTASNGGAMQNITTSDPQVINCTFFDNYAVNDGGGLNSVNASASIVNSIFWLNTDTNGSGDGSSAQIGGTADVTYSCVQGGFPDPPDYTNIDSNPVFRDELGPDMMPRTGDEDLRLDDTSPCTDAGYDDVLEMEVEDRFDLDADLVTAEPLPIDLAGVARQIDFDGDATAQVDMGAYEAGDLDGDGLLDVVENAQCTDAENADTDGDGLTDGEEVVGGCPDPCTFDSDGDGMSDGEEVHGQPPTDPCNVPPQPMSAIRPIQNAGPVALVRLDASGTMDPDDAVGTLTLVWTVDDVLQCEGSFDTCAVIDVELAFGNHVVALTVTDNASPPNAETLTKIVTIDPASLAMLEIDRAKIRWAREELTVAGEIELPVGVDHPEVLPLVCLAMNISGTAVLDVPTPILLELVGDHRWRYRDPDGTLGVTTFRVDWRGAVFHYHEHGFPAHLKSQLISSTGTVLTYRFRTRHLEAPLVMDIGGLGTVTVDPDGTVMATGGITVEEERPGREVTLTLPFPLLQEMVVTFSGGAEATVPVNDHFRNSVGRYRLQANFTAFGDGAATLPRTFEIMMLVGSTGFPGTAFLDEDDLEVSGDDWIAR